MRYYFAGFLSKPWFTVGREPVFFIFGFSGLGQDLRLKFGN